MVGRRPFALACVFFAITIGHAHGQTVAILAGTLLDPATGEERHDQYVLVKDGIIAAIGPSVPVAPDAIRVDLSQQTVLPGLIDAHTHLLGTVDPKWDLGSFWIMAVQRRGGFRAIQGVRHAREMLESGFTTVRDVGNAGDYLDADLEKAIRFGVVPGPTVIFAGRIIAPFGGQFWDTPADGRLLDNAEYRFADSRDELRKAVRENIYWGARVIKLVVDGQRYVYSAEDIRFVVEEARAAGVPVAAHVQTERGAQAAIEARVASIEHGWELTDDTLALAKKNNVSLVSTDFTVASLVASGMTAERAATVHARHVARLRRAREAGVIVVFGTDTMANVPGKTRGQAALDYIDNFVEAGFGKLEILQAMTVRAAELLGVSASRGALRPGMAADLVATPLNPLRDIQGLKRISFVMKDGVVHRRP